MSTMFYVVCIVAIVLAASTVQQYFKLRARKEEQRPDMANPLARLDQLEERIQVLERIVTENKFELRRDIDKL